MSLSSLVHRNPLPELADGWEGPAPGSGQTSRRMGGQVGDRMEGPDFPLAPWGFCSLAEHLHKISYVLSPNSGDEPGELARAEMLWSAQRRRHAGFRCWGEGGEHEESGVNPISS